MRERVLNTPPRRWARSLAGLTTVLALVGAAGGCSSAPGGSAGSAEEPTSGAQPTLIRVPGDASTIGAAVERAAPGSLILVGPGTYQESVVLDKPGLTLRGADRNAVVIDGGGLRPQGVLVVADGVRVENLTVRNHTFNGVLVTGMHDGGQATAHGVDGYTQLDPEEHPPIQRFAVSHVTAGNNGLYGVYAFDAQHGTITDSYASGSADSGFYVGQCRDCDILVSGNVAEHNAIGFENANASDSVVIAGNRFSDNRVGMTLISNYQEAFRPQRANTVVGNVIADNAQAESPAQADGGFGIGIGIAGGQDNDIRANLLTGNPLAGLLIQGTEDIPARGNRLTGNEFAANGVDIADISSRRSPSAGNCLRANHLASVVPASLAAATCPEGFTGPGAGAGRLPQLSPPPGMSFLDVPPGLDQPGMTGDLEVIPEPLPAAVTMPDLSSAQLPAAELLAERVRR